MDQIRKFGEQNLEFQNSSPKGLKAINYKTPNPN